jgi:hypothetical protein
MSGCAQINVSVYSYFIPIDRNIRFQNGNTQRNIRVMVPCLGHVKFECVALSESSVPGLPIGFTTITPHSVTIQST